MTPDEIEAEMIRDVRAWTAEQQGRVPTDADCGNIIGIIQQLDGMLAVQRTTTCDICKSSSREK